MKERFFFHHRQHPSDSEVRSWMRSFPALARDLVDAGRGHVEMQFEYEMPRNSKRADVLLSGVHPQTGADSHVVVELKQWGEAMVVDHSDTLVSVPHMPKPHLHPVVQARAYCEFLAAHKPLFSSTNTNLEGVAYLHNAADSAVSSLYYLPADRYGRLFTKDTRGALLSYLGSVFAPEDGARAADTLAKSPSRPTRKYMEFAAPVVKHRDHFVLLDEQRLAYELVMRAAEKSQAGDHKEIVIVTGGPGSGKSAIALQLLADMMEREWPVELATGSRSFTTTLRRFVGRGSKQVQALFTYFNSYLKADKNALSVLICDEAHRIREVSHNRFTKRHDITKRPQVDELIDAARVPVFLLDEHQVVKPGEIGTVAAIRAHAAAKGLEVSEVPLDGQFRCGGSKAYEDWVLRLLDLEPGGPVSWPGDDDFELVVVDSPEELESITRARHEEGSTARMAAGYCWEWSTPANGVLQADVKIGGWHRPWNVKGERKVGDAPPSPLWATDPAGFDQIGCVYTAQGFEYDWNGVILGPDIVVKDGRLTTVRSENKDPAFRFKTIPDDLVDQHIRNIYKVLLTRGMKGTAIYAVDPDTRKFLMELATTGEAAAPAAP
ncbi:DNA/RNA helicase domain-containing protein [Stackebrandtia endophytica]|nr:DUF2075 domain-containing protein [Stackebrandtia endophytica]